MKNNSFRYLHLLLVVCSLGLIFSTFMTREEQTPSRRPTSLPKPRRFPKREPPRASKIQRGPASTRPYSKLEISRVVKPVPNLRMKKGHVLAENIGAVPLADWKPSMPPLIFDDGVYGYFEKRAGDRSSIPVAYNPTRKGLAPISSIVHIRGVDEATRERIKALGFQEYYYFKNIQRLSLKSSPAEVVRLYQELEKQGFNAKLEVLSNRPQSH